MNRSDFSFELPAHLIAQNPADVRSESRLLMLERLTGRITHQRFYEIGSALRPGDCLVINDSRVIPARLVGKTANGATIEMLLHEKLAQPSQWTALCKPGKKAKPGDVLVFGDGELTGRVEDIIADGLRVVSLRHDGELEPLLEKHGQIPLPHYIHTDLPADQAKERYQTVYAEHDGSVAAPTAGLHFTHELLAQLQAQGVRIARVTLHVGLGTFRPVKTDDITEHVMHHEYCQIHPDQAEIINQAKQNGGRVIAVGTTACRTLESRAQNGAVQPGAGKTGIFIYPGYTFKMIDGLITNFHLPESTLIMLVSAFAGRENVLAAYHEAIREGYRFYSFGDAMVIV